MENRTTTRKKKQTAKERKCKESLRLITFQGHLCYIFIYAIDFL